MSKDVRYYSQLARQSNHIYRQIVDETGRKYHFSSGRICNAHNLEVDWGASKRRQAKMPVGKDDIL